MPVEPSKGKLKRRSSRKEFGIAGSSGGMEGGEYMYRFDGHGRELEMKRNRGMFRSRFLYLRRWMGWAVGRLGSLDIL